MLMELKARKVEKEELPVEEEKPTEEDETLESYSWQTPRFEWHS